MSKQDGAVRGSEVTGGFRPAVREPGELFAEGGADPAAPVQETDRSTRDDAAPVSRTAQPASTTGTSASPAGATAGDAGSSGDAKRRAPVRRVLGGVLTVVCAVLVFLLLVAPGDPLQLGTWAAYARIPLEALLGVGLLLLLPRRAGRWVAIAAGVLLALITLVRAFDLGFTTFLAREFDPLGDWGYFAAGASFLQGAMGLPATIGIGVALGLLVLLVLVLVPLAVLRVGGLVPRHRAVALPLVAVLAVAWVGAFSADVAIVPDEPVASRSAGALAVNRVLGATSALADEQRFREALAADPQAGIPADQQLQGLAGRDVALTFVESYGRVALEDPVISPEIVGLLDDGTRELAEAGFQARSGFLTSPIAGGGSWLAHNTFLSGVRVADESRHDAVEQSSRLALTRVFGDAGWRTVGIMPGVGADWPEQAYYGYDHVYPAAELGYEGPNFSWSSMPDQYTMQAFERLERGVGDRAPIMAEIPLVTSHSPWRPVPELLPWDQVGDGTVFGPMAAGGGAPADILTRDPEIVRSDYAATIRYSLSTLVSYLQEYGDGPDGRDLVMIVLGDHQPAPMVTGDSESRDVPITIITRDQAVLDRIAGWDWDTGLRPAPDAPVLPMQDFRDRFLEAYRGP